MVPKVNSGANVYGVLQYNRIKVEAGEGRILYMQGIPERSDGRFSIEECAEAFGYYTALNPRVRKPVVHFSLNPSPEDRLSEAQLTRLAAEFMERMGYGRQPYVVFLHEDIARRHMHVVSVRVDEQGRKIDHNNELRRAWRFAESWNTSTVCMCPKTAACKQNRKNCAGSITVGAI